MKKVLFITYFFPPVGAGGVQRTAKFVKYLNLKGWDINVITNSSVTEPTIDPSLMSEISHEVKILRTKSQSLFNVINKLQDLGLEKISFFVNQMAIPDHYVLWLKPAYYLAKKIIMKQGIPIIYTTSGPVTSHLIGLLLKNKLRHSISWVADFRDPWSQNKLMNRHLSSIKKRIDFLLEKRVLGKCDHVIHSTEENRLTTINIFKLPPYKVTAIYNGYDEHDFEIDLSHLRETSKNFNVIYTGNFYLDYNPGLFINSIKDFLGERDNIKITFVGEGSKWVAEFLKKNNLTEKFGESIKTKDHVEHKKGIKMLYEADLLLLFLPKFMDYCVPGKLYEYLRTGKPILALINKVGETAKIINKTNTGYIVDPEDEKEILSTFKNIYNLWQNKELKTNVNFNEIKRFDRNLLTDQLIDIFRSCRPVDKQVEKAKDSLSGTPV